MYDADGAVIENIENIVGWDEAVEDVGCRRRRGLRLTLPLFILSTLTTPQLVSPLPPSPPSPPSPASASTSGRTAAGTVPTVRRQRHLRLDDGNPIP